MELWFSRIALIGSFAIATILMMGGEILLRRDSPKLCYPLFLIGTGYFVLFGFLYKLYEITL